MQIFHHKIRHNLLLGWIVIVAASVYWERINLGEKDTCTMSTMSTLKVQLELLGHQWALAVIEGIIFNFYFSFWVFLHVNGAKKKMA